MPTDLPPVQIHEPQINKSGDIRKFDLVAINRQLDAGIATLPENATGAVIGVVDSNGAHLAIVGKKKFESGELAWSVVASKPYDGKLDYAGQVRWAW